VITTRDDEVEDKKPLKETRSKKVGNANPRGRPRGSKNLATLLEEALDTPVASQDAGTRRRRTKRDVVIAQLVDRSANADLRATKLLLDFLHKLERSAAATDPASAGPEDDVYAQLRAKLARLAADQSQAQGAAAGSASRQRVRQGREEDERSDRPPQRGGRDR
jgi:hypothetical protein